MTAGFDDHVLHVPAEGADWWVEHPLSCPVRMFTERQLDRIDEPLCPLWELEPDLFEDRIEGWPLRPGRYVVGVDVDATDPDFPRWIVSTAAILEPEVPQPAFDPTPRRLYHGGMHLRSMAELHIAVLLDLLGIGWRYEPRTFELGGMLYTPDFITDRRPGIARVLEVKNRDAIRALAVRFGMPAAGRGPLRNLDQYEVGPVRVDGATLEAEFAKPFRLAAEIDEDVWVIGGYPKVNQPYVVFHPDGSVSVSRRCPLFRDRHIVDEVHRIVAARRTWEDGRDTGQ